MATEIEENHSSSRGYALGPPWLFRGSALYQLHLVKSATARAFIPKELKLVEAFGYTLGGFFLARYDDSPDGAFDELVVISGIVWNPPTSCAWAARVLVNSEAACIHGRKEVGLPSQVAVFSERKNRSLEIPASKSKGFPGLHGVGSFFHDHRESSELQITEITGSTSASLCAIALPFSTLDKKWGGPNIRLSLPSYSGKTKFNPNLLKYSCNIECRVQPVVPAKVSAATMDSSESIPNHQNIEGGETSILSAERDAWNRCISVLLSKPILALRFNCLKMVVHAPMVVPGSNDIVKEPS